MIDKNSRVFYAPVRSISMEKQTDQKHGKFLLVDFENVQKIADMSKIDSGTKIIVFLGSHQTKLSFDLVSKNQKLGSRLEWKQIEGSGKNAVDMVIAYHMGKAFDKDPQAQCTVLSKDKGFDPLIKMLKKEGKNCQRIESIAGLK
jgi:uncharacterized LabA/DUF88 family protein